MDIRRTKLEGEMLTLGWNVCSTGGGCEAYYLSCPTGGSIMLTDDGGLQRPTRRTQKIMVGVYDDDGQQLATFWIPKFQMILDKTINVLEM